MGAGWNDDEHAQLGLPFPEIAERGDILEEPLEVLRGLWGEPDGWSFDGRHVQVRDALFYPKPVARPGRPIGPNGAPRPRILTGSSGSPRAMRIAARYADEFNLSSASPDGAREWYGKLDDACRAIGRDPASIGRSVMAGVLIGRDDAEVSRRKSDLLAAFAEESGGDEWFDAREPRWIVGTPDEARAMVTRFEAAGAERVMLQDFLPRDLDMISQMAEFLFD
jgi:alkanesulfonate monooxygenase